MSKLHATSHFVQHGPLRLHHLDWGNAGAHPIVLMHGVRLHAHVWNDFARRVAGRYHVIALDQRGHGDSAWGSADEYQIEEYYRDLQAVLRARGIARFTLVGHSLGGMVSMFYTHRHPEEVERLVLVDISAGRPPAPPGADLSRITETPPPRDFDSPEDASQYLAGLMKLAPGHMVEESARHGLRRTEAGRYTWKYDPALLMRRPAPANASAGGNPAASGGSAAQKPAASSTHAAQDPAAMPPDLWGMVGEIKAPTLLQYGSESRVVTSELAERMRAAMPDCTVERIERAGHALFTDRPDEFAAGVERFLAGKDRG